MKKRPTLIIILLIVTISVLFSLFLGPKDKDTLITVDEIQTVRIALSSAFITAPVLVARQLNYFAEEGIDLVVIGDYGSGRDALNKMLDGGADISTVATTPVVLNSFSRDDNSIFVTYTTTYEGIKVIARTDKGISSPLDLRDKRIAVVEGTISELLMDSLLAYSKIPLSDVSLVYLTSEEMIDALINDEIDAISIWEPYANNALTVLKDKGVKIPTSKVYRIAVNLAVMNDFARDYPDSLVKIVRALSKAVAYMNGNKEEAMLLISEILDLDIRLVEKNWDEASFNLSLDQLLLITMENEASWAIDNVDILEKKSIPDYLNYIYFSALSEVDPDAVSIIREKQ
ncbi:MAG: NrtA/SsuA/CpmA family ABC transporter substrate-binding protein [Spirochaetales bacterium]|nr:NrtA/SsuA/CpmA family ABC transporter substrate-binding protein [Spirochaetales bacterium]